MRKTDFLTAEGLLVARGKILKKNTPGHTVNDQMMNGDQQMISIYASEQTQFHQRTAGEIDASLDFACLRFDGRTAVFCSPEVHDFHSVQLSFSGTAVPGFNPPVCSWAVYGTQRIMMLYDLRHRLAQRLFVEALLADLHESLIAMVQISRILFEEPPLNRRECHAARHFFLARRSARRLKMRTERCNRRMMK